jgi:trimeric autotransporter adhesin
MLALAMSCTGFFVKPTLSSLSVGPATPTIETGSTSNTVQMFAVGTFNDGSTSNPAVSWSITPTTIATISSNGLVTSVATGTATVTATATQNPAITGTQSITVTVGCIQSITISPSSGTITNNQPSTSFTATAATCNGSVPITDVATWTSSNTAIATVSDGIVTATGTTGSDGTITITAASGNIISNPVTVTVSGF